jgi:phage replication-related protein YjqB (UPF0714/DUF867 family)
MRDRYRSWEELARYESEGTDYQIRTLARPHSPVVLLAPHGGRIEHGTSELAVLVAGTEHNLFSFEGLKPTGNRVLHITSHRFDHPGCLALLARCQIAVALHGCSGAESIYVGGRDEALAARLMRHLSASGFVCHADGHRYPGRQPLNICNRTARDCGAQLELTPDLREPVARPALAAAIRAALAEQLTALASAHRSDGRSSDAAGGVRARYPQP